MWECCNLFSEEAVQVFQQMTLIKIREDSRLWMRDWLRDLGRGTVREANDMKLEKQSRRGNYEEALEVQMSYRKISHEYVCFYYCTSVQVGLFLIYEYQNHQ